MAFDMHLFMLHNATQAEAIEVLRKAADAGESLSPRALRKVADILDHRVDGRGRRKSGAPLGLLFAIGRVRALYNHGFLKKERGQDWKSLLMEVNNISRNTIDGAAKDWKSVWHRSYFYWTFRLYAFGYIKKIKMIRSIDDDVVDQVLSDLLSSKEITEAQAKEVLAAIR